jgi:hypothetical protein
MQSNGRAIVHAWHAGYHEGAGGLAECQVWDCPVFLRLDLDDRMFNLEHGRRFRRLLARLSM